MLAQLSLTQAEIKNWFEDVTRSRVIAFYVRVQDERPAVFPAVLSLVSGETVQFPSLHSFALHLRNEMFGC